MAESYSGDLDAHGNPVCTVQASQSLQQAFLEDFTYAPNGQMNGKTLHMVSVQGGGAPTTLAWSEAVGYNSDGSPLTVKYPDFDNGDGTFVKNHTATYGYNLLNQVGYYYTDQLSGNSVPNSQNAIQGTAFNAAGQPFSTAYSLYGFNNLPADNIFEYRSYNSLNQLAGITSGLNGMNLTYNYSTTGTNNGQIASLTDGGQTVTYSYDSLKRLTGATATGSNPWGQTYGYDGFGNMDAKNGSTAWNANIDPATNRVIGYCYDGNGNLGGGTCGQYVYDIQNRMVGAGGGSSVYLYNAGNKRVATINGSGETVYFYGVRGEKLATFTLFPSQTTPPVVNNVYFAGRLVERNNTLVQLDRLGSVVSAARYLPYGEEITTPHTPNDTEKFATYTRDSATGLDYADQRYYNSIYGRFMSADPYKATINGTNDPTAPASWNRYSYSLSDPINRADASGNFSCSLDGISVGCSDLPRDLLDPICSGGDSLLPNACGLGPDQPILGGPPNPPAQVPCTSNSANIFQTYADIGLNILEIAEAGIKDLTSQEVSGLQTVILGTIAEEGSSITYYNGGHFNLDLSASELRDSLGRSDFRAFSRLFGGRVDGTRQAAVYGNPAQGNYTSPRQPRL